MDQEGKAKRGRPTFDELARAVELALSQVLTVSSRCVELLGSVTLGAIAALTLLDKFLEEDLGDAERERLLRLRKLLRGEGKPEDYPEYLR